MKVLRNQEIDKVKWDKCIDESLNSLVYAYSWYLDVVCPGWNCIVEDDYSSVFPLTAGKKFGINYLYQPYFAQQLGIFSKQPISENTFYDFFNNIPSEYKFIEICLNNSKFKIQNSKFKTNLNLELDLNHSYQEIYDNYSTNANRNLNKANKFSVTIKKDTDIDLIINLFRNNKGKTISNLNDRHYNILKKLVNACIEKGRGMTYGAYSSDDKLCAGIVIIESESRYIFLFSGSNEIAKNNGAMFLLIDNLIKERSGKNALLDFEGSNDKNLANFYKGFGAKEKFYYLIRKNNLPLHLRIVFVIYKFLKKIDSKSKI